MVERQWRTARSRIVAELEKDGVLWEAEIEVQERTEDLIADPDVPYPHP